MKNDTFYRLATKEFSYLVNEYGFHLETSGEYYEDLNWRLIYHSSKTTVRIILNKYVTATFNPIDRRKYLFPPNYEFRSDIESHPYTHVDVIDIFTIVGYCNNYPARMRAYDLYRDVQTTLLPFEQCMTVQMPFLAKLVRMYAKPLLQGEWTDELILKLNNYDLEIMFR